LGPQGAYKENIQREKSKKDISAAKKECSLFKYELFYG